VKACTSTFRDVVQSSKRVLSFPVFISFAIADTPIPQTIQWSSKSYGPDGPWQAVTIKVGSILTPVGLLPG
jgi:hypothetical protein